MRRIATLAIGALTLAVLPFVGASALEVELGDTGVTVEVDESTGEVTGSDAVVWTEAEVGDDGEVDVLVVIDTNGADKGGLVAFSIGIEPGDDDDDADYEINVRAKDQWDDEHIAKVMAGDDDDDDDDEPKAEVCHRDRTLSIGESDVAEHLDHGDTEGACAADSDTAEVGDEEAPGAEGRATARDAGGNAYGYGAEGTTPPNKPSEEPSGAGNQDAPRGRDNAPGQTDKAD